MLWNKAAELAGTVYQITKDFPNEENYGITSQLRRSAVSISSNIAEGAGRSSTGKFHKYPDVSFGSACELETQLWIAKNLNFPERNDFNTVISELNLIQKMLYTLRKKFLKINLTHFNEHSL